MTINHELSADSGAPITKPFSHAMLMSGGGSRFGYYLGMYAAAVEYHKQPDAIFASCGGAIAAGLIGEFDSVKEQKEALLSHELHQMVLRVQYANKHALTTILFDLTKRYLLRRVTKVFPDLEHDALFEIHDESKPWFPFNPSYTSSKATIYIVGSKLCFDQSQVGQFRKSSPLFEEVILSDSSALNALSNAPYSPPSSLIKSDFVRESSIAFQEAIRISVSDIYYLPPYAIAGSYYMGGMLDLVPFHLAQHCSATLSLETKHAFSSVTAVPAFYTLLGYNPNDVLRALPTRAQDVRINTADSPQQLQGHQIHKKIHWLSNKIALKSPNYDQFRAMMQAQWDYGYQRTLKAFQHHNQSVSI
ncbi:hypothetical protein [Vibrio sp. TRT 17S01]|uniref:hypothetical protein n=1 Tax=Vibrio sp. TRT 17S01 TaxID=3418505 RepID=UPI003CE81F5F